MKDKELKILIRHWSGEGSRRNQRSVSRLMEKYPQEYAEMEEVYRMEIFEHSGFERKDPKELLVEYPMQKREAGQGIFIPYGILRIAAVFLLTLMIGGASVFLDLVPKTVKNASMESKEIVLPDQTMVTLDQGAELTYRTSLTGRFRRECHLDGRAYFKVNRDENDDFRIETTHALVTVLGTRFTVSTLQEKMQLILEEGSVKVSSNHNQSLAILNQPGDQVLVGTGGIEKQNQIRLDLYMSWMDGRLQFNNCTVGEALDFLGDTWGLKVVLPDTVSSDYLLMGTAPTSDPELIMEAIRLIIGKNE